MTFVKLVPGAAAIVAALLLSAPQPTQPSGPELAAEASLGTLPGELGHAPRGRAPWRPTAESPQPRPDELWVLLKGDSRTAIEELAARVGATVSATDDVDWALLSPGCARTRRGSSPR